MRVGESAIVPANARVSGRVASRAQDAAAGELAALLAALDEAKAAND